MIFNNNLKKGLIDNKYVILSSLLVITICISGYYGYNYYDQQQKIDTKKTILEKIKKDELNKKTIDLNNSKKQEILLPTDENPTDKKQKDLVVKIEDKNLIINNNNLVKEKVSKEQIKNILKEQIKNQSDYNEVLVNKVSEISADLNTVKDGIDKNINVLEDTNKENVTELKKQIDIFNSQIDILSKSIQLINNNYLKNNKIENKGNYITEDELKIYFNQNNDKINEILSSKFNDIDKKLIKLEKSQRINSLNSKVNNVKKGELKNVNYNVEEIPSIEFEYVGFDIITNNNSKEKVAYITKVGSEKIYTVSMETEIENKYVLKDLDSQFLYIKLLSDNKIYKLKILE